MGTPEHIRQQQYRKRRAAKLASANAMEAALTEIVNRLDGNDKPLAVEIRTLAQQGLNGGEDDE